MALTKKQLNALSAVARKITGGKPPVKTSKTVPGKGVYTGKDAPDIYAGLVYGVPLPTSDLDYLPEFPLQ